MRMSRITNNMLATNYTRNTQMNLNNMSTLQNQLSTGKLYSKPSDNAVKVSRIMGLYSDISANEQYKENIKDASSWLDTTDAALGEVNNLFSRVRELMVTVGNGSYSDDQRQSIQTEIKQKVSQLAQILNTNFDGSYIFGGTKSQSKPVMVDENGMIQYADSEGNAVMPITDGDKKITDMMKDGKTLTIKYSTDGATADDPDVVSTITVDLTGADATNTESDFIKNALTGAGFSDAAADDAAEKFTVTLNQLDSDLKVEISQGVYVEYNKTAVDIMEFKDADGNVKNVSDLLNQIIYNLNAEGTVNPDGTTADHTKVFGSLLSDMDQAINNLLSARSDVGVISNRMESAESANTVSTENMTNILAKTEDVDYTEKIMEYSMMQTVYMASLQVSAKILPQTIMDYL